MANEEKKDFNAMLHRETDMPKIQIVTDEATIKKYGGERMYFAPPVTYDEIMKKATAVGVGMASPARIDEINILQATYEAMRQAIEKLGVRPDLLLNDAVTIPGVEISQVPIIKGDAKSVSIAAASIIAKVTRDRLMVQYDEILPGYGFARHKGYGSAEHIEAIRRLGPTPIHRQTFIKNFL